MNCEIRTIHGEDQRYATAGDWQFVEGNILVLVSEMEDKRYEFLVGIHELIEAFLCKQHGITQLDVDQHDMKSSNDDSEPGDAKDCPYRREHAFATSVERLIAYELGVNWYEYENYLKGVS